MIIGHRPTDYRQEYAQLPAFPQTLTNCPFMGHGSSCGESSSKEKFAQMTLVFGVSYLTQYPPQRGSLLVVCRTSRKNLPSGEYPKWQRTVLNAASRSRSNGRHRPRGSVQLIMQICSSLQERSVIESHGDYLNELKHKTKVTFRSNNLKNSNLYKEHSGFLLDKWTD